jgi:hypothetical protein
VAEGPESTEREPQSEEELRARIEEGLRQVRVQDVVLESTVTIINLTARRIGKDDERDLEQARVGIEAVRALVELLEPEPAKQVRSALAELQMLYARQAGTGGAGGEGEGGNGEPEPAPEGAGEGQEPPGARGERPPPGLWVPPGSA